MNEVLFPVGPCVLVLIALASVWDLHARRIPNWLVGSGLVVALIVQAMLHGALEGLAYALGGCLVGGVLMLPGYALRLIGAGDVKLMGVVGAFCGAVGAFEIVLVTAVIGGVWSLGTMIVRRETRRGMHGAATILMTLRTPGAASTAHQQESGARPDDVSDVVDRGNAASSNAASNNAASNNAAQNNMANSRTNDEVAAQSMGTLPYGVAIALGTVFVLFASA
ncbi:MAG TPA: prepilin peptidase [Pararobbsia sp.]|nr:prepilin peptidase [Pararobbsia sp.]